MDFTERAARITRWRELDMHDVADNAADLLARDVLAGLAMREPSAALALEAYVR